MLPDLVFPSDGIVRRALDAPPPSGFDCGRDAQNRFLYDWAWHDQQEGVSTTSLYYVRGILAAYATICMDSLELGSREKPKSIRHREIAAMKLAQLGVDRRFQGQGLGKMIVASALVFGKEEQKRVGCRYVTLDAQPDLVSWYEGQGFAINKVVQKRRIETALASKRPVEQLAVSMRFDLRPP